MMIPRVFILSATSLALLLLLLLAACLFPHVEAIKLRSANIRAHVHALSPMKKFEPPSTTSTFAGGTTAMRVGRRHRGLGATSTTTATTTSITTTTTMMAEDDEMSPSEFYMLHHREHGLALAEEAAAAALEEDYYEESDPRQRRRRGRRRRRELVEVAERQRERPHLHDDQQQEEEETSSPEEEEVDEAESEQLEEEEEESGQVEQQPIGGVEGSASPTGDGDGDGHDDDDASVIAGPPFSPPSSNPDSAVDGSDVSIDITDDCNVTRPTWLGKAPRKPHVAPRVLLGDGRCDDWRGDGYNTAECGWDGGDCCYQTCRDGVYRCGGGEVGGEYLGYVCRDPRFSDIVYDEEGERDPQRRRERQALEALYDATNGDGWDDQGRWLNETLDHCYWDRETIGCTGGEGYAWRIYLEDRNLNGTLPTEIGELVHLERLWLEGNEHLSGTIPASIGQLTELTELWVSGSSLSGPVPANVMMLIFGTPGWYYSPDNTDDYAQLYPADCADVVGWVDGNGRGCDWYVNDTSSCATDGAPLGDTGHAADTACCACGLYGRYDREREVLEELFGATNGGGWHDNSFWADNSRSHCYYWTGVRCNSNGMVTNITLPSNNLHGSLPTSIGELRSLQILDVSNNDITGGIPTEVYTLTKLEGLHLRDVSLGGTVPTQIAALKLLRRLDLSHNGLDGPIPVDITDMSLVEDLRLSHNQLTGYISPEFRRMSRLKRLDLNNNKLEGSIPVDLGLLGLLRELRISNQLYRDSNLDWHALSGPIPVELGDCQYLEVLDLSDNLLTGVLPTELARLARMKSLLLHNNKFEGYIPSEYGLLPSLESLMLGVWWDEQKLKPAPLSLCFDGAFDLHSDPLWCPPERNALKRLYDATGGDGWSNNANWTDPYGDHCSWYGVGCDVHVSCRDVQNWTDSEGSGCDWYGLESKRCKWYVASIENNNHTANTACCVCQQEALGCFLNGTECIKDHVTSLFLNSNGLSGSLPAELGQLTHLERLHLADNALVGGLPADIANLTKLHLLNLTGNALSGGFPEEIASLPSLAEVHLSRNELSGELSINSGSNPSKLTILNFANNKFGGELSAAFTQLSNFPYLREIDMSYNSFHGSIPSTPMDGITKLTVGGNERTLDLDLDLQNSAVHCPVLSFLRLFYDSTNGTSWNWDDVAGVCDESSWHGIKCDETKTSIVAINLTNYGLSGTLPDSLGEHMSALSFLRVLDLSHNGLHGPIPVDLTRLSLLEEVRLANNSFNGTLPAQISNLPRLKILDVTANQLTGTLPIEFGRLSSLRELRLSNNHFGYAESSIALSGTPGIPVEWGDLANVEYLDLNGNFLAGEIPQELGKLGRISHMHLHDNIFTGQIPTELGHLPQIKNLTLRDNKDMLRKFYDATNGNSWADKTNWLDEYNHPCNTTNKWFGITCANESRITGVNLIGNGLYGTLPKEAFELMELRYLKLGDNRLYGTLPTDFEQNANLETLQLSGNEFSGEIPVSILKLSSLSLLHLHSNKFTSGVPSSIKVLNATADCGDPYYYGDGKLACDSCTICCNSEGTCREVTQGKLSLRQQTGLYMGCLIALLFMLGATVSLLRKKGFRLLKPERSAFDYCGQGSVYCFCLSGGYANWIVSALTVAAQLGIFVVFLHAANVYSDSSDWEYFLRCPSNQLWCPSDHMVDYKGWLIFGVIMVAFLGKDLLSGMMLVYTAGLRGSARCMLTGVTIASLTGLAVWTSTQYNLAIATTNTALIANAVIILFVNDMDEKIFELLQWLAPNWAARVLKKSHEFSEKLMSDSNSDGAVAVQQDAMNENVVDENSEESEQSSGQENDLHAQILLQGEAIKELRAQVKKQNQQIANLVSQFAANDTSIPDDTSIQDDTSIPDVESDDG